MLICHKRAALNEAVVLQACHMSDVHATMQPHRQCLSRQHRERLCAAELIIQSYLPLLFSQIPSLGSDASPPPALLMQLSYPWKLHACQANNNYFQYIYIYFLLYVFGIVLNCIIQNNSYCLHWQYFLYNYLWQMHQIIHLSPAGCFTPARGETVQKKREVSGINPSCLGGGYITPTTLLTTNFTSLVSLTQVSV